jgi:5-methylthioribose kinase
LQGVLRDALGFAGCKMARRIVGVAHVADFTSIVNVDVRAKCERRALRFGRRLLVHASTFSSIDAVIVAAEETRTSL